MIDTWTDKTDEQVDRENNGRDTAISTISPHELSIRPSVLLREKRERKQMIHG